jgi:hypothetical protein
MRLAKLCAITLLAVVGVAAPAQAAVDRGALISFGSVSGLDPQQVQDFLTPLGVYVPQATLGVDTYRISYRTVDVRGRGTTATAFAVLPRSPERRLRPAIWLHGTQSYRQDAPSLSECCDRAAAILFASIGYAAVAPDYLGLGDGPGTHPYFHAGTAVSASVDALRAARQLAARQGREMSGRTMVAGFSQGANNSFLLARALQQGADRRFQLGALAPISGAYELFKTEWPAALDGTVKPAAATYYLAYITVAWNRIYHLYDDESAVFKAPYASTVERLFDGTHTIDETMAGLPGTPDELLQASYKQQLLHPTGRLRAAAMLNDTACLHWTPSAPVRMYGAHGDPEAVYANSLGCLSSLHGADVTLTDVGDVDHITSLILSMPHVASWFAGQL